MAKRGKFAHHHKAAGEAHAKGDHATAMHHVGHMMAALRSGSPDVAADEPEGTVEDQNGPPVSSPPTSTLRSRLSAFRR